MKIFMLRSKPHKIERINEFLKFNFVAIGWTSKNDLTGATKEDIRKALQADNYEGQSLSTTLGMVNAFVCSMKKGDLVLVREDDSVHIGKVGDYKWRKDFVEKHMAHTRPVEWLNKVPFKDLNASVQSLLKNIKTIAQYREVFDESEIGQYISDKVKGQPKSNLPIEGKEDLLNNAIEILKDLANNSKDEHVRLEATKELLSVLRN